MTLLSTERLFWPCEAHTAEPKIGLIRPIPPIPNCQNNCCFLWHMVGAFAVAVAGRGGGVRGAGPRSPRAGRARASVAQFGVVLLVRQQAACERRFGRISGPLSSCRGPQAALNCPHHRDSVTRH